MTDKREAARRDPDGSEECSNNNQQDNQAPDENQEETCTDENPVGDLLVYKDKRIWTPWANRLNKKPGRLRKIPFDAHSHGLGDVSDPTKWGTLREAQARYERIDKPYGGGLGIVLGDHGSFWLGGLDLDGCRNAQNGAIAPWAHEVIDHYPGYWEISPSQTGLKGFFIFDGNAHDIRRSKTFKMAGRDPSVLHGPQIEFYLEKRWFAVTGQKYGGGAC